MEDLHDDKGGLNLSTRLRQDNLIHLSFLYRIFSVERPFGETPEF